jgi:hypothetical protein
MKLNSFTLAVLVVAILFGGISLSSGLKWWHTESTKEPIRYSEGAAAGQYNPADIRGSYTFGDINRLFAIPLDDLQVAFRLPADRDAASYQLKELEALTADLAVEVGTASVRMFVAFYKSLPYDLAGSEETYLFPEAAAVLKAQNTLLPEQAEYLLSHLVPETNEVISPVVGTPDDTQAVEVQHTPAASEHVKPDKLVNGQTSFQDLLNWGVRRETLETILGDKLPAPLTKVKDYAAQKGLEFSRLKNAFQVEVDKTK